MNSISVPHLSMRTSSLGSGPTGLHQPASTRVTIPPLTPRLQLARAALVVVLTLSATLLLQLVFVSGLQQSAAQQRAFDVLRSDLANGVAPIGPTDDQGRELKPGTPVAMIEIPSIDVNQVVVEGTSSAAMFTGPGHRRDTPLPGQVGLSSIFGRRSAYGGPFGDISTLNKGDVIRVITGQGTFEYSVIGVRRAGDPLPTPQLRGTSRLHLATADGVMFMPNGVVHVDADLNAPAVGGPARTVASDALPGEEGFNAGDSRTVWALAFWLQALLVLAIGAIWAWHRWGRIQAWVVCLPPLLLVGLSAAGEIGRLLPNLM